MGRENATINGVIVPGESLNIEHWKENIKTGHEAPDKFGKSKTVEFEDTTEEDGSSCTNYWVF